jgi:TRAP-type C4-dicarboxylate transport system permease small subunit
MAELASTAPPRRLESALGVLSALPLALIVTLTFVDVFARYLFARPIRGSLEIVQVAMALVIFTALPLVTRARGHITVSLIDNLVTGGARRVQRVLCDAVSTVALTLMTWRLFSQAMTDVAGNTKSIVLGLPQAPLVFVMCGFAAASTVVTLMLLTESLRRDSVVHPGDVLRR